MTGDDVLPIASVPFQVGVAIQQLPLEDDRQVSAPGVPGYDEASGRGDGGRHRADRRSVIIEKGGEAVRVAAEAIASQIGLAAQHIAAAIERQAPTPPVGGALGLDSVEVSFGVTLAAGVQALFTTQAESSAMVTITLSRSPAGPDTSEPRG